MGVEDKSSTAISPQVGDNTIDDIVSVPWGHHKPLTDKFKKAIMMNNKTRATDLFCGIGGFRLTMGLNNVD